MKEFEDIIDIEWIRDDLIYDFRLSVLEKKRDYFLELMDYTKSHITKTPNLKYTDRMISIANYASMNAIDLDAESICELFKDLALEDDDDE